ncbi:hypothetical protein N7281_06185 [Rickettsia hoogstraalii]|uniref:hypothetical protein n=1 Tax=Rickettsia hoogstraalii TaxID=467174 RepID=UPI00225A2B5F|nr:hypothetical protein [Rickettsia hoogstraalii]MCX4084412.1 hypothetical protein [Rickettsia hoogstraalii]
MEINSVFDKLLPEVLIIEEKNKKSVNISLSNDIERAGFNIIRASTLEKALTYFFSQPLAIMIISAELQENPLITINNVRKINKFSKTPIIFLLTSN